MDCSVVSSSAVTLHLQLCHKETCISAAFQASVGCTCRLVLSVKSQARWRVLTWGFCAALHLVISRVLFRGSLCCADFLAETTSSFHKVGSVQPL